jgi:hypothetical protein
MTNERRDGRRSAESRAHLRHYPSWEQIAAASQLAHVAKLDSHAELRRAFRDDRARQRFLERLRWPDGFVCWRCGCEHPPVRAEGGLLCCGGCGFGEPIIAGCVLEHAELSLGHWFDLLWVLAAGALPDAGRLARLLHIEPAKTQRVLASVRALLSETESQPLEGLVELDARAMEVAGRHIIALVAAERRPGGRVRVRHSSSIAAPVVRAFVIDAVYPGTTVVTDCWSGYVELASSYHHALSDTDLGGSDMRAVSEAGAALRRWLLQHSTGPAAALQHAFDAFCVHHNNAHLTRGELFAHLARAAIRTAPPPRGKRRRSGVRAREREAEQEQQGDRQGERHEKREPDAVGGSARQHSAKASR